MPTTSPHATRKLPLLALIVASLVTLGAVGEAHAAGQRASRSVVRPVATTLRQSQDSYNRDIRVHNQTGWTMTYFYAAASGSDEFGGDLLGSTTLEPGDSLVMTVDDGSGACRYDFRAQFDNGEALRRAGINVCQVADYYFTR